MHAGTRILRINTGQEPSITVCAKFTEHQSMNYGSDVIARKEAYEAFSTSFYDKLLCFWRYNSAQLPVN